MTRAERTAAPVSSLSQRFVRHVRRRGLLGTGDRVVVAVSGGLDSVVLLHLLRFGAEDLAPQLHVAHFDHRMRPGSEADARWVRGLSAAWDLPFRFGAASAPPTSEAEARVQRYAFLEEVRSEVGARAVVTAHHADDQAETVLFRVLRGTGLAGLAGIAERRAPGVVRPLLPFFRAELEAYARAARIRHLEDPTNRLSAFARNRIRHALLPWIESEIAPRARRALVRVSCLAHEAEAGWESLLPGLLADVGAHVREGRIVLARSRFVAYHSYVQARILHNLLRRFGTTLDEAGTRAALEFINFGESGRTMTLGGGVRLAREFDRITVYEESGEQPGERPLRIHAFGSGTGVFVVGGRRLRATWSSEAPPSGQWCEAFDPQGVELPLTLRGWRPGDRLRLPYGTKKLKKLFGERRIPARERSGVPILVDGRGVVLWVPELARSVDAPVAAGRPAFFIALSDARDDTP